jgi:hypothetical protein
MPDSAQATMTTPSMQLSQLHVLHGQTLGVWATTSTMTYCLQQQAVPELPQLPSEQPAQLLL